MTGMLYTVTFIRSSQDALTGDWGDAVETTVADCALEPVSSPETSGRSGTGDQVVTTVRVYPREGVMPDVVATDRARLPGESGAPWQVVGDPERWTRWGERTVITLERTTG